MSFLKNNKRIFMIVLVLVLIGGGTYYFTSILSVQLETLEALREDNAIKQAELTFLEEQLKALPDKERYLKDMQMEINSINDRIPSHQVSVMMMMQIVQYMDIYDFQDTEVEIGEAFKEEEDNYFTIPVTINYATTYGQTINLIEEISRSFQMITVESLSIDNGIQEQESEDGLRTLPGDWVEAELVLSLYYKEHDDTLEYPNYINFLNKEENVFLNPELEMEGMSSQLPQAPGTNDGTTSQQARQDSLFDITLADIYRSGDNYSFSAYSPGKQAEYLGLTSSVDTKIALTIRDNGYSCLIEDAEGKTEEKKVSVPVKNPSINITSQIQKIAEIMPTVKIYVYNNTSNIVNVKMRGSELQNVMIYNENGVLVPPGKQIGKVALTI